MKKPKKKPGSQAATGGKRSSAWSLPPESLLIVGIDIKEDAAPTLLDEESNAYPAELDEAMIANVRHHGVIEPVIVMRDGDRNLVVDGRTRVRWARCAAALQKKHGEEVLEVPYVVRRGKAADLYGVSRSANRRRPEDSPVAQAGQLQRMINMCGGNEEEAAVKLGLSPAYGKKLLRLLDLAPKVQGAVERGMAVDAAVKLAKLPREEQVAKLAAIQATGEKPTARKVENKLREGSGKAPVETPAQKLKRLVAAIEAEAVMYENVLDEVDAPKIEDVAAELRSVAFEHVERLRAILRPPPNGATQPAEQEAGFGA